MRKSAVLAIVFALVSLALVPAVGAAEERHSGTIVSFDPTAGTLVLQELTASPSQAPAAVTRTIAMGPGAHVSVLRRSNEPSTTAWPGGFVASSVPLTALRAGDFVTVVGQERNGQLVGSAVEISRDESSPSASPR